MATSSTFQKGTIVLVTNVDGTTVPASQFFARGTVVKVAQVDLNGNPVATGGVTSVNGYTGTVTGAQAVAGANIAPGNVDAGGFVRTAGTLYWGGNGDTSLGRTGPSTAALLGAGGIDGNLTVGNFTASGTITAGGVLTLADGTVTKASTGQLLFGTSSNALYLYSGTGGLIVNNQANTAQLLSLTNAGALTLGGNASFGGLNIAAATNPALTYGGSLALTRTASGTVAVGTTSGATDGTVLTTNLFGAGGFSTGLVTKSAAYTATAADHKILVDSTSATVTITLPTAVGIVGKEFIVKDWKGQAASHNITVAFTSSQTCDGATTKVIASAYFSISFVSDGANWSMF